MVIVRWGRVVSRNADVASGTIYPGSLVSGAVVSGNVAANAVVSGNIAADAVQVANLFEAGGSASAEGLTATVYHNLGVTPTRVVLTQLSSAYLGTLHEGLVNNSALVVGTTVSGSYFRWWVLGG